MSIQNKKWTGINLRTSLFHGFAFKNPITIASSQWTENKSMIKRWCIYAPGALTIKTTLSNIVPEEDKRRIIRSLYKHGGTSVNLYADGPKHIEYLTPEYTNDLIAFAKSELPETKVGASILLGDEYESIKQYVKEADFVELNLKYTARLGPNELDKSYFDIHKNRFDNLIKEIERFIECYRNQVIFIKLTRELPWLNPCYELTFFLNKLLQYKDSGLKIGLIVANTERLRIPSSWTYNPKQDRVGSELSDGILAGEDLFLKTYNIIKTISLEPQIGDRLPILATGGIVDMATFVESIHAGASAVQMCTAFQKYNFSYYSWIIEQLSRIMVDNKIHSFDRLKETLRKEPYVANRIRVSSIRTPREAKEKIIQTYRKSLDDVKEIIKKHILEELKLPLTEHPDEKYIHCDSNKLHNIKNYGLPSLNDDKNQESPSANGNELNNCVLLSNIGLLTAHSIFTCLSEEFNTELIVTKGSNELIDKILFSDKWDLAFISDAHLNNLCRRCVKYSDWDPVILGVLSVATYHLMSPVGQISLINDIYHYGGLQSTAAIEDILNQDIIKKERERIVVNETSTEEMLYILQSGRDDIGMFAKDPLCTLYYLFVTQATGKVISNINFPVYLIGSKYFVKQTN